MKLTNSLGAHTVMAIVAITALVIVNLFGKENEALTNILSGVVGASIWGAVQRQKWPVDKTDSEFYSETIPDELQTPHEREVKRRIQRRGK